MGDDSGSEERGPATARLSDAELDAVRRDPRLRRLFAALDACGAAGAPRRERAAECADGVSVETLDRLFHATFGCTYSKWVERWRVDDATRRLERAGRGADVRAVAEQSGFGRAQRMIDAFKRRTGRTPTGRAPSARRRGRDRKAEPDRDSECDRDSEHDRKQAFN